jgi:hypothetical protein
MHLISSPILTKSKSYKLEVLNIGYAAVPTLLGKPIATDAKTDVGMTELLDCSK